MRNDSIQSQKHTKHLPTKIATKLKTVRDLRIENVCFAY